VTTSQFGADVLPTCWDPVVAASHTDNNVPPSPPTANHASQPSAFGDIQQVSSSPVSIQNRAQPPLGKCLSCMMGTPSGSLPRFPSRLPKRMRSLGTLPHSHTSKLFSAVARRKGAGCRYSSHFQAVRHWANFHRQASAAWLPFHKICPEETQRLLALNDETSLGGPESSTDP